MINFDAIEAGLTAGEFFLEYMPTISLEDGRCVGAEALIRWRRPTGIVSPLEFIPLVENTRLSGPVTYWVIETVAAELGAWLRSHDDVHLGINVPPELLGRGGLQYAVSKAGLTDVMHKIVLEITERSVPDKLGVEALTAATSRGVRVALDDVNISGANIIVLSRCHVEIIKLDMTLIGQIGRSAEPPAWLQGLSTMMRSIETKVIAEGVETALQSEVLRAAGVTMAQGYYFSRPLSAQAFLAFFQTRCRGTQAAGAAPR